MNIFKDAENHESLKMVMEVDFLISTGRTVVRNHHIWESREQDNSPILPSHSEN